MSAIVPAFESLKSVALKENSIGSHGAALISDCLASKPDIEFLYLSDTLLNDGSAILLAISLTKDSRLRLLRL